MARSWVVVEEWFHGHSLNDASLKLKADKLSR